MCLQLCCEYNFRNHYDLVNHVMIHINISGPTLFLCLTANQLLKPIASCHLIYSVGSHKAMLTIIHLLPENVIVGNNTVVPGIEDKPSKSQQPVLPKT